MPFPPVISSTLESRERWAVLVSYCFLNLVFRAVAGVMCRSSIIFRASAAMFSVLTVIPAESSRGNARPAHFAFLCVLQLLVNKQCTLYVNWNARTWCGRFLVFVRFCTVETLNSFPTSASS